MFHKNSDVLLAFLFQNTFQMDLGNCVMVTYRAVSSGMIVHPYVPEGWMRGWQEHSCPIFWFIFTSYLEHKDGLHGLEPQAPPFPKELIKFFLTRITRHSPTKRLHDFHGPVPLQNT